MGEDQGEAIPRIVGRDPRHDAAVEAVSDYSAGRARFFHHERVDDLLRHQDCRRRFCAPRRGACEGSAGRKEYAEQ